MRNNLMKNIVIGIGLSLVYGLLYLNYITDLSMESLNTYSVEEIEIWGLLHHTIVFLMEDGSHQITKIPKLHLIYLIIVGMTLIFIKLKKEKTKLN